MEKVKEKKEKIKILPEIEFPKEIEFLDKLNKHNEEKYKKWRFKKTLNEKIFGKSTLIIGVRGKDGIVLGSDKKIIRGGEIDSENKVKALMIEEKIPIIFAAAGVLGVRDDFLEVFEKTLTESVRKGEVDSLLSIKMIAEDLIEKFVERYGPRLEEYPLQFILGGLAQLEKGEARLYEIGPLGFGAKIEYYSLIGHGSPYARTIGKYLFYRNNKTEKIPFRCNEIIPRIATCIYWIGGEIDDYVGGDPQIVYILDGQSGIKEGKYDKDEVLNKVNQLKENFKKITFQEK